jgi:hypothetical protein
VSDQHPNYIVNMGGATAERVAKSGCAIAHIGLELYFHMGGAARTFYER